MFDKVPAHGTVNDSMIVAVGKDDLASNSTKIPLGVSITAGIFRMTPRARIPTCG